MSILVPQNVDAAFTLVDQIPATLTNGVPAYSLPLTMLAKFKMNGWPNSGLWNALPVRLLGTAGYAGIGIQRTSSSAYNVQAESNDGTTSGNAAVNIFTDNTGWKTAAAVFTSTISRNSYAYIDNVLTTAQNTANRVPTGVKDIRLMSGAWNVAGAWQAALIKIYSGVLTEQEIAEYDASGTIVGKTPLFSLDGLNDWGSNQIVATGLWGASFDAPANWTYSTDNPVLGAPKSLAFDSNLTPGQSISGDAGGFVDGDGVITGGGLSFPVAIVNERFLGIVPDFSDDVVFPLLPQSVTWTLTQGATSTTASKTIDMKPGWTSTTIASLSTTDYALSTVFDAAGDPLTLNDVIVYPVSNGLVFGTDTVPEFTSDVSGTLYIRRFADGKMYSHGFIFTGLSVVIPPPIVLPTRNRIATVKHPSVLPPIANSPSVVIL